MAGIAHNAAELEKTLFQKAQTADEYRSLVSRVIMAMQSK